MSAANGSDALTAVTGFARPVRILGIGGSTRQGSRSQIVLETALRLAEEAGAWPVPATVRDLGLPVFDDDLPLAAYPPTLTWLLDEARQADAFLICSPTYHATIAGGVKNVLDALNFLGDDDPPYFGGKPVGLLAYGGGSAANVLTSLYHATRALGGLTVPTVVAVPGSAVDGERRDVTDPGARRRLGVLVGEVVDLAWRLRRPAPVAAEPWEEATVGG